MKTIANRHKVRQLGVLLIGGKHHILHLIPIVSELELRDNVNVTVFVRFAAEKEICKKVLELLGCNNSNVQILKYSSTFIDLFKKKKPVHKKKPYLLRNLKLFETLDALIVAERTSTYLLSLSKSLPPLIHIPHGAGDGAKSYDPRIKDFDYVLVAGEKDRQRMIDDNLVTAENCYVTGYIKPFAVRRMDLPLPQLFKNKNPIVFYNAHFNLELSSWPQFGKDLLDAFSHQKDMNFIFAPHMRLFQNAPKEIRQSLEAYGRFENIHIDLGSERSTDMSYTRLADIYLGDVSSQIYEFLSRPKPCVFIGDKDVAWKDNPDYAHWKYGDVCHNVDGAIKALTAAKDNHGHYISFQKNGTRAALGNPDWNPIKRAADIVMSILAN